MPNFPNPAFPHRPCLHSHARLRNPRTITEFLAMLRSDWSKLQAIEPFLEMARVLQYCHSLLRDFPWTEPQGQQNLEDLFESITRFYLEDDGRSLSNSSQRLSGIEQSIIDFSRTNSCWHHKKSQLTRG